MRGLLATSAALLTAATFVAVLGVGAAMAADTKGAATAAAGAPGSIVIGGLSVPVLNGRKVRIYEYAIIGLKVANAGAMLKQVCDKRFELVDAFLSHLHAKPFTSGSEVDGARAQQEMLALAKSVGGDFVTGIEIAWSKTPRPIDNSAFGNTQAVPCKTG